MSMLRRATSRDDRLDAVFHALSDGTRRRLIERLSRGPIPVGELAAPFSISLAAISKHLDVLEKAGVVRRERDGRFQRCHLTPHALDSAGKFIQHYRSFWQSSLDQLAEFVEDDAAGSAPRHGEKERTP